MSKECKCGEQVTPRQVQKDGANKGRWFYSCNDCKMFEWTSAPSNNGTSSSQSKSSYNGSKKKPSACSTHQQEPVLRKVMKADSPNIGKYFWTCPEQGCKAIFKWENSPELYQTDGDKPSSSRSKTQKRSTTNEKSSNTSAQKRRSSGKSNLQVDLEACSYGADPLVKLKFSESIPSKLIDELREVCTDEEQTIFAQSQNTMELPLKYYREIVNVLNQSSLVGSVDEIPEFVINPLLSAIENNKKEFVMNWNKIPKKVTKCLLPFQKEGVEFGVKQDGRVLIGDEMGLGKTIQAIAISSFYYEEWPMLILCPSALRENWRLEIAKWLNHLDCSKDRSADVKVVENGKESDLGALVSIVSYTLASTDPLLSIIKKQKFKVIIADECHALKSDSSNRSKALCPVIKKANRAILLSGTASPSRPIELYTQFKAVSKLTIKKTEYGARYCDMKQGGFGVDYKGASRLAELNLLLSSTVMIRRLKSDVLKDLPPKRRSTVFIEADKQLMAEMKVTKEKQKETKFVKQLQNPQTAENYKSTGLAKLASIKQYVKDLLLLHKEKFLVFAHHIQVLDGIEEVVSSTGKDYIRIDGSTDKNQRIELASHFRSNPDCSIAILSITVAGTGLSFTPCSMIVFAELHWTPGILAQAEDRCHRIGQTASYVDIRYLLAKGTADDTIWPMIKNKLDVVGEVLDADKNQGQKKYGSKSSTSTSVFLAGQTNLKSMFEKQVERAQTAALADSNFNFEPPTVDKLSEMDPVEIKEESLEPSAPDQQEEARQALIKKIAKQSTPKPSTKKRKSMEGETEKQPTKKRKKESPAAQKNTLISYFSKKS